MLHPHRGGMTFFCVCGSFLSRPLSPFFFPLRFFFIQDDREILENYEMEFSEDMEKKAKDKTTIKVSTCADGDGNEFVMPKRTFAFFLGSGAG